MQFDNVIGQDELKEKLISMIDTGRIGHALMFVGKEGTGNLALALAFAENVLRKTSPDESSCLQKTQKFIHPDLHFCYPINSTKKITGTKIKSKDFITEWRQMLSKNPYMSLSEWLAHLGIENKQGLINVNQANEILLDLRLKPYESEFKIMLIWLPEKMNHSAANKILKMLEEPPKNTLFLLVSQNPEQLLTTIQSRVQIINVKPIAHQDLSAALISKFGLESENASNIARIAQGNYLEAQKLVSENEIRAFNQDMFIQWMRFLWQKEFYELVQWSETMAKIGRERQMQFFRYGLHVFRESLVMNYADESIQLSGGTEKAFVKKFSPYVNELNAIDMVELFDEAIMHISRNANPKIMIMDISLKMMKLVRKKVK